MADRFDAWATFSDRRRSNLDVGPCRATGVANNGESISGNTLDFSDLFEPIVTEFIFLLPVLWSLHNAGKFYCKQMERLSLWKENLLEQFMKMQINFAFC
jgi:hypothetical protein